MTEILPITIIQCDLLISSLGPCSSISDVLSKLRYLLKCCLHHIMVSYLLPV